MPHLPLAAGRADAVLLLDVVHHLDALGREERRFHVLREQLGVVAAPGAEHHLVGRGAAPGAPERGGAGGADRQALHEAAPRETV